MWKPTEPACGTTPSGTDQIAVALPVVPPPGDRVSHSAQDPQNQTHHRENDPDRPKDGNAGHETDDKQDDSEDDHDTLRSRVCSSFTLTPVSRHGNCPAGQEPSGQKRRSAPPLPGSFVHIRSSSLPGTASVTGVAPRRGPTASACADSNDEAVGDSGGSVRTGHLYRPLHQQRAAFSHGETPSGLRFVRHE